MSPPIPSLTGTRVDFIINSKNRWASSNEVITIPGVTIHKSFRKNRGTISISKTSRRLFSNVLGFWVFASVRILFHFERFWTFNFLGTQRGYVDNLESDFRAEWSSHISSARCNRSEVQPTSQSRNRRGILFIADFFDFKNTSFQLWSRLCAKPISNFSGNAWKLLVWYPNYEIL